LLHESCSLRSKVGALYLTITPPRRCRIPAARVTPPTSRRGVAKRAT